MCQALSWALEYRNSQRRTKFPPPENLHPVRETHHKQANKYVRK